MPPDLAAVPKIPDPPPFYAKVHPDRVKTFPNSVKNLIFNPDEVRNESQDDKWRHELKHDAESVFWLLLYWAMVVQPEKCAKERINAATWDLLTGDHKSRNSLIVLVSKPGTMAKYLIHSFYEPLRPLINDLAAILVVDGHWLPASDPRTDLYYVTEAFQRLILNFIIKNRGEQFMDRPVEKTFREVQGIRRSCSATIFQTKDTKIRESVSAVGCVYGSMDYCRSYCCVYRARMMSRSMMARSMVLNEKVL